MTFQKGIIPWNKGKKGLQISWNKGLTKLSDNRLAKSGNRNKRIAWNKGIKTGIKPGNYIDGRSKTLGPARYGDDWDAIRYLVYRRDKFQCQHCNINGIRLDIHHKIPFLFSGDNSLDNLITLCRKCHMTEEHKMRNELKEIKIELEMI